MAGRTAGFYFSAGTVFVSTLVILTVLTSSLEPEGPLSFDVSRDRWVVLFLAAVVLGLSAVLMYRYAKAGHSADTHTATDDSPGEPVPDPEDESDSFDREAVLATLPEDEQKLYSMISEAGGELLQMHIVSSGIFSKAKVTRLLDKLEGRGLVVRERHGMTNRVRLIK